MPLNPDAVGAVGDPRTISWGSKDALLYAVGIGAGQHDLAFTTENTKDLPQVVYPTFAVVAGSGNISPGASAMTQAGTFNWALLVHGSQAITLHRPIPVEAEATTQDKLVAMYDKGKAAVVVTEAEVKLASGEPLWTTRSSAFIRGEGGWGGDRGPSGPQNEPPERAPDHEITLQTSDIVPGMLEAATLFAQQAKDAGIKVNVKKEAANAYFDTSKLYTKMAFAQSFWTFGSLSLFYEQALLSDAVWNETHYRDPAFDQMIRDAQAAGDETQAKELWHAVQQTQYDEGGYIMWANAELLDGLANDVQGLTPNGWFNLGGYDYKNVWFDR